MKYIEAAKFGGPEVFKLVEKETPRPEEGTLLVEVQAAGVNYGDVLARSGHYPTVTKAPFVPGFEIAGIVREVGTGANGFKPGDTVAAFTPYGGGYASHVVIPAVSAIPVPSQLDPALAAAVFVQGVTAYLLLDQAQAKKDDVVLVAAAAGGVGGLAVQLAKVRGAKVIGLASESKFEIVKRLGADYVFDYGRADWSAKVLEVTRPRGVHAYLDSVGDLASRAFELLGEFGRWIVYGVRASNPNGLPADVLWPMIGKSISLLGFNLGGHLNEVPSAVEELFKLAIAGKLKVEITKFPLTDATKVHTLFEAGKSAGKLVLIP